MTDLVQAMIFAAGFAPLPLIMTIVSVSVSRRAVDGRLPPNKTSGIRTRATISSDRAWVAAHSAALRLTPLLVAVTVVTWIVLFATAWKFATIPAMLLAVVATAIVVITNDAVAKRSCAERGAVRPDMAIIGAVDVTYCREGGIAHAVRHFTVGTAAGDKNCKGRTHGA